MQAQTLSSAEAVASLHSIAKKSQWKAMPARLELARSSEVQGLVKTVKLAASKSAKSSKLAAQDSSRAISSAEGLEGLDAGQACDSIWALAVMGGSALYEAHTEALIQVGQGCGWQHVTGQQVADMCWGLATARHCTPALPGATQQLSLADLAGLKPRLVTAMLWGCAVLLHQPGNVLTQLTAALNPEGKGSGLDKFSGQQLASCAWALSVLQQQANPLFHLLWAHLLTKPKQDWTNKAALMQLHQAVLEGANSGSDLQSADKQGILTTAKRCWLAETFDKSRKRSSFYARDITSVVIGLGKRYLEEDTSTGYAVDVSLPTLKIAIEADGPTHRCRNSKQPLGGTVMKQRHLNAAGWQLITVAHDDWDELRGRKQKLDFLHSKIAACMDSK